MKMRDARGRNRLEDGLRIEDAVDEGRAPAPQDSPGARLRAHMEIRHHLENPAPGADVHPGRHAVRLEDLRPVTAHDTLGPARRPARVDQMRDVLGPRSSRGRSRLTGCEERFITLRPGQLVSEDNEVANSGQAGSERCHPIRILTLEDQDRGRCIGQDPCELRFREPEIEGRRDASQRVVGREDLEVLGAVHGQNGDAVARADSGPLERVGEPASAGPQLGVVHARRAEDEGRRLGVEACVALPEIPQGFERHLAPLWLHERIPSSERRGTAPLTPAPRYKPAALHDSAAKPR